MQYWITQKASDYCISTHKKLMYRFNLEVHLKYERWCGLATRNHFYIKKTHLLASASETSVRINGLEPLRLSPLDPKSSAATNYAISAWCSTTSNKSSELIEIAKIRIIFETGVFKSVFFTYVKNYL